MTRLNRDIELRAGATKHVSVTVENDDGIPHDLQNGDATWVAIDSDGTTFIEKSVSDGTIDFSDAADGIVRWTLEHEDTTGNAGRYDHELHVEDSDGNMDVALKGKLRVKDSYL